MTGLSFVRFVAVLCKEWLQMRRDPATIGLTVFMPLLQLFLLVPSGLVPARAFWLARAAAGRVPPVLTGVDGNAVLGLQFRGCDGAAGAHGSGIPPVPLPRMRQAIQ